MQRDIQVCKDNYVTHYASRCYNIATSCSYRLQTQEDHVEKKTHTAMPVLVLSMSVLYELHPCWSSAGKFFYFFISNSQKSTRAQTFLYYCSRAVQNQLVATTTCYIVDSSIIVLHLMV